MYVTNFWCLHSMVEGRQRDIARFKMAYFNQETISEQLVEYNNRERSKPYNKMLRLSLPHSKRFYFLR